MIKVAIVEDNIHFQSALVNLFENADLFELIGIYSSAENATDNLPLNPPDVAIVDIQLPEISGITLIKKIKELTIQTQYLVCTFHQDNEYIFDALRAGASGCILKDASADEIKNAVKDIFNGQAQMSPYIARKIIGLFQIQNASDYTLNEQEEGVLKLMSAGLAYNGIAEKLNLNTDEIKGHLKDVYKKLHKLNDEQPAILL